MNTTAAVLLKLNGCAICTILRNNAYKHLSIFGTPVGDIGGKGRAIRKDLNRGSFRVGVCLDGKFQNGLRALEPAAVEYFSHDVSPFVF